jgi:hypothetical protein
LAKALAAAWKPESRRELLPATRAELRGMPTTTLQENILEMQRRTLKERLTSDEWRAVDRMRIELAARRAG